MARIRLGVVPVQIMEDRWFIYWHDGALYLHRSWTGFCIYVARFAMEGSSAGIIVAEANRDRAQYSNTADAYDVATLLWLIDHIVLGYPEGDDDGSTPDESA